MASRAGDCILVYFVGDEPIGTKFAKRRNDWPLHVTILTWFRAEDLDMVHELVALSAAHCSKLQLTVGEEADFNAGARVNVIANQDGITMLHNALLATLEGAGIQPLDKQWTGENYTAHITQHDSPEQYPAVGSELLVDEISLVQLLPDNICEVVRNFNLGTAV